MRNTQGTNDAFGAQKGLLRYATHFLKHSVLKTGFSGTRCVFGGTLCKKQASLVRQGNSVPETPSYGTELALGAQNSLLRYATHFLKHSVLKTGFSGTAGIFGTGNTLLRYGMKRPDAAIAWIALI